MKGAEPTKLKQNKTKQEKTLSKPLEKRSMVKIKRKFSSSTKKRKKNLSKKVKEKTKLKKIVKGKEKNRVFSEEFEKLKLLNLK